MGTKVMRRLTAVLIALVMVIASGCMVFAAGNEVNSSSEGGDKTPVLQQQRTTAYPGSGQMTVKIKATDAKTYLVAYRKVGAKTWTYVKTTNPNATIKNLTKRGYYEIRSKAYNGKAKSNLSSTAYRWMQASSGVKATTGKGTANLTWKKTDGATGYKITYAPASNTANAKVINVKRASSVKTALSGLKKGTYYYYVRPYKVVNGKTYLGASIRRSFTVK